MRLQNRQRLFGVNLRECQHERPARNGFCVRKKNAAQFFTGQYLSCLGGLFYTPSFYGWGLQMNDREELRRLIDMIEKASSSDSVEQAVDDIKTFANTASFLANKLDTRLKSGKVKAKKRPKSRMGGAIASMPIPKPRAPKSPTTPSAPTSSRNISGMPQATSISTSQADFDRLKPQGSQSPIAPL